jgi:hypothetical protein
MNVRFSVTTTVVLACSMFLPPLPLAGQNSGDRKPAAAAPWTPARLADGQPDVQGFWTAEIGGTYSLVNPRRGGGRLREQLLERQGATPPAKQSRIVDPPDGQIPYQPWARAKQQDIQAHIDTPVKQEYIDPQARCLPDGPMRSNLQTTVRILQSPGYVVLVYEQFHPYRVIPLDGRPHLGRDVELWMGDSRGHWEGNTLVVDVSNNNSKSRLDTEGDFATDKLHITERFTFTGPKTMEYQATLDDPSVYTRPWTIAARMQRAHANDPDYEVWEDACHEGERNADNSFLGSAGDTAPGKNAAEPGAKNDVANQEKR